MWEIQAQGKIAWTWNVIVNSWVRRPQGHLGGHAEEDLVYGLPGKDTTGGIIIHLLQILEMALPELRCNQDHMPKPMLRILFNSKYDDLIVNIRER